MGSEIAISVKNLSKNFRLPHERVDSLKGAFVRPFTKKSSTETQHALKDISFDVKKGEFFGIVGRNGSGKSTLLKMIAGIYRPTKGSVTVNGRLVPFIELGVGFNPELTGRENVFLNGALMGFSPREIRSKYNSIVEFAELERFMDQKLKNYSSGMQVRLAFSVATVLAESDILLIDEVLAVGDADFQRKCFDYFKGLKKKKKTVIFVSHDMGAIVEYCDRVAFIDKNALVRVGSPEKIALDYKKLFQEVIEEEPTVEDQRWGDGSISITAPSLAKKQLSDEDQSLKLSFTVTANKDVESVIIGFSIDSPDGSAVLGTNNVIKQEHIKSLSEGASIKTTWTIPNVFSDGRYTVNLDATYDAGNNVADRWGSAESFRVVKVEKTPHIVSPRVSLDMEKIDA